MDNEKETAPPPMTGKASDIPVPSLGTPEPSSAIPPLTGEVYDAPRGRKRGRRTSAPESEQPQQETPPPEQDTEALASAMASAATVVFSIIAAVRGDHWNIKDEDAQRLGQSGAVALGPYMASTAKYLPLALFGLQVAGLCMPRLQQDAKLAKELDKDKETPQAMRVVP